MSLPIDSDLGLTKELVSPTSIETSEKVEVNTENQQELMKELRLLILAPEQKELSQLKHRLDDSEVYAKETSNILPRAIRLSLGQSDDLTEAIQPSVEAAIKVSVKKDPSTLVEALFPVMGPAIRKAIAQALSSMLQTLNQTMENSLSFQGLKWRLESIRTGRSFAEIVMLKTLLYRVEQVFLIHKETGLLLQHLISPALLSKSDEIQDADMVSGMFTAIQDFVRDSFGVKNQSLEELQVGELTVWIEQGPQAFLAGVLRGNAPKELRPLFQEALEKIHLETKNDLKDFQGDASVFETVRPWLEDCLQSQYEVKDKEKKTSPALWAVVGVLSFLLLSWAIYSFWHYWHWQNYLTLLSKEPGIVITRIDKEGGKYFVSGLLDPLAKNPEEIRKQAGLSESKVITQWEPYQAIKAEFILARAKKILDPPQTITLKVEGDALVASGTASHQWIRETRRWSRLIAGINSFKEENLINLDVKELEENKKIIEQETLLFINDKTDFVPGQENNLSKIFEALQKFTQTADLLNQQVQIEIFGQTDSSGSEERNSVLSQERADKIVSLLIAKGLNPKYFTSKGIGTGNALTNQINSPQNSEASRRVIFRISLIDSDFKRK